MKTHKGWLTAALMVVGFVTTPIFAQEKRDTHLIRTFAQCNHQFFEQLYDEEHRHPDLKRINSRKIAHFLVEDRENSDKSRNDFREKFALFPYGILGYYDSVTDLSEFDMGRYYFWGIVLEATPEQVSNYLNNFDWKREGRMYYTGNEIYNPVTSTWEKKADDDDRVFPEVGTEKMLYIQKLGRKQSMIVCSVQGEVPEELLKRVRPDL